jgi:hypothetical protein
MVKPLEQLGATESAHVLTLVRSLFDSLKDIDSEFFIDVSKEVRVNEDGEITVEKISAVLSSVRDFMNAVDASKAMKAALENIKNCLKSADTRISFVAFSEQMKALLLADCVAFHVAALEANLGKHGFDAAYTRLVRDSRVTKPKLAKIATQFVARTPTSMTKPQILQRIHAHHKGVLDLEKKNQWQHGKSAA